MQKQKIKFTTFSLLLMFSVNALAQSNTTTEHKGQGYGFVAPLVSNYGDTGLQAGFGGEGMVYKGLGVGGEISYLNLGGYTYGLGAVSPNASYHFRGLTKDGKVVPFVTGGYSLYFRNGVAHGLNFGGGVNYWFKERVGLRVEVRDQVLPFDGTLHYVGFRAGISFR